MELRATNANKIFQLILVSAIIFTVVSAAELSLNAFSEGVAAPDINVTPASYSFTLDEEDSAADVLKIRNDGDAILTFSIRSRVLTTVITGLRSSRYSSKGFNFTKKVVPVDAVYPGLKGKIDKSISAPEPSTDIVGGSVAGAALFAINTFLGTIEEFDPATGTVINSFPVPEPVFGPEGLAFDGVDLFFISGWWNNIIFRLDRSTGAILDTVPVVFPGTIDALAHSGEFIYALDFGNGIIYVIDATSGELVNNLTTGGFIGGGLSFGGSRNTIFVSNFGDSISEIDPETGSILNRIPIPGLWVWGLGYSEALGALWVGDPATLKLYLIDPDDGTPLDSIALSYLPSAVASDEAAGAFWLTFSTEEDTLAPDDSIEIDLKVMTDKLDGGVFDAEILVVSNDPVDSLVIVPVSLTVNSRPIIGVQDTLDIGNVFVGYSSDAELIIENIGSVTLTISSITSDNTEFVIDISSAVIQGEDFILTTVTFTPVGAGSASALLTINSDDPENPVTTVDLLAVGLIPPVIGVSPDSLSDSLFTGETATQVLTISNTGGSDLIFEIFTEEDSVVLSTMFTATPSSRVPGRKSTFRRTQSSTYLFDSDKSLKNNFKSDEKYSQFHGNIDMSNWSRSTLPAAGDYQLSERVIRKKDFRLSQSLAGVDVPKVLLLAADATSNIDLAELALISTGKFEDSDIEVLEDPLSLSLSDLMPYDVVLVWTNSNFSETQNVGDVLKQYVDEGGGVILATYAYTTNWAIQGGILEPDYSPFIPGDGVTVSGQLDLGSLTNPNHPIFANLSNDPTYWWNLNYSNPVLNSGGTLLAMDTFGNNVVAENPSGKVVGISIFPTRINVNISDTNDETRLMFANALYYVHQPIVSWIKVNPSSGIVSAESTLDIDITFDASGLFGGDYVARIIVESNDPITPATSVATRFHVTGAPDIGADPDTVDFGKQFVGYADTLSLEIFNDGTDVLTVTDVVPGISEITVSITAFVLSPLESKIIDVGLLTVESGLVSSELTFTSDDPDEATFVVPVIAESFIPPVVGLSPDTLIENLFTGETSTLIMAISNTGGSDLIFEVFTEKDSVVLSSAVVSANSTGISGFKVNKRGQKPNRISKQRIISDIGNEVQGGVQGPGKNSVNSQGSDFAYVANANDNSVSVIDIATNTIVGSTIPVGSFPWRLTITPDGDQVWVSNRDSDDISIIDIASNTVIATVTVGDGPSGIIFSPDGDFAYVANRWGYTVMVVNTSSLTVVDEFTDSIEQPMDLAITPDGEFLYVANRWLGIAVIDLSTGSLVTLITMPFILGVTTEANEPGMKKAREGKTAGRESEEANSLIDNAHTIKMSPDGSLVYVSQLGAVAIDVATNTIIADIRGFNRPHGLDFTPDGEFVYVIDKWNSRVMIIETATHTVVDTISDPSLYDGWGLAIEADGNYAYASAPFSAGEDVIVIDIKKGNVLTTLTTGGGSRGVATLQRGGVSWLSVDPDEGVVAEAATQDIDITFDAFGLYGGNYFARIIVDSNDPMTPTASLPTRLHVTGAPDIAVEEDSVEFKKQFVGFPDTLQMVIINEGTDILNVTNITPAIPEITVSTTAFSVNPNEYQIVDVGLLTSEPGVVSSSITIDSDDPDEPTFTVGVSAQSFLPPIIGVVPGSYTEAAFVGDTLKRVMTISNTGGSFLEFDIKIVSTEGVVPAAAALSLVPIDEGELSMSRSDKKNRKNLTGSSVNSRKQEIGLKLRRGAQKRDDGNIAGIRRTKSSLYGSRASGIRSSILKKNDPGEGKSQNFVGKQTQGKRFDAGHTPLRLDSPEIRIPAGVLSATEITLLIIYEACSDITEIQGLLAAYPDITVVDGWDATTLIPTLSDLLVYDAVIVVNNCAYPDPPGLGDVLADYVDDGGGLTLTIATFFSGLELMGRLADEGYIPFNIGTTIESASLGTFDPTHPIMEGVVSADGFLIMGDASLSVDAEGVAFWDNGAAFVATKGRVVGVNIFVAYPGFWDGDIPLILHNATIWSSNQVDWLSADPDEGIITEGTSQDIEIIFDATNIYGGDYFADIVIETNDPANEEWRVPVYFDVTGIQDIHVDETTINFGPIFVGFSESYSFKIHNVGTDWLDVTNIQSNLTLVTVNPTSMMIAPKKSEDVEVTVTPTTAGVINAVLTISSNDADEPMVTVNVTAEAFNPPVAVVTPDSVTDIIRPGDVTTANKITIKNTGESVLEFEISDEEIGGTKGTTLERLGHVTFTDALSDVWGYSSPEGVELAIVGLFSGTAFVDASTDPMNPYVVATISGPSSEWRDMKTWGHYAYIVNETGGGLQIVDMSDPMNPFLASTYTAAFSRAHNLFIDENGFAYIVGGDVTGGGIQILDLTDPENPVFAGEWTDWYVHDLFVRGNIAYAASLDTGLTFINVSNKGAPGTIAVYKYANSRTHNVWITDDGNYALTTDETIGGYVRFLDINDISNVTLLTQMRVDPSHYLHNVFVEGDLAYLSAYVDGAVLFDISDPSNPSMVDSIDTSPFTGIFDGAWGIYPYAGRNLVYVSDVQTGLWVLRSVPTWIAETPQSGSVAVGDSAEITVGFFATDIDSGDYEANVLISTNIPGNPLIKVPVLLQVRVIIGVEDEKLIPKAFALEQNYPNPFNPSTTIRYALPKNSNVSLIIYNLLGQEIIRWDEQNVPAGYYEKIWNGNNKSGIPVGSGMYIYRLRAEEFTKTKKMILLK